ncbi:hypothetical protein BDZ45DRAFT_704372 [Acephala macrosclerotiorum]|nr:hypothetical protein BDZ45DRAFT_704372 [Acephala macrosclerotiorum]
MLSKRACQEGVTACGQDVGYWGWDDCIRRTNSGVSGRKPIMLDSSGGFEFGGRILLNPKNPNETLSCDHGYTPRNSSLVMWHSSSTQVFQNRWDGGPGNFAGLNFGPSYMNWWPDVQFPINDTYAWQQATSARYDEFDTDENVLLHTQAMAVAADSRKLGDKVVYLTNSAAGLRAQITTTRAHGTNIAAIVTYESIGFRHPVEQCKKLANLTAVQFVWGDHRAEDNKFLKQSILAAKLINEYGGSAEVLMLRETGLKGSTHIAFADMDNGKVAGMLEEFLRRNGLDEYADEDGRRA